MIEGLRIPVSGDPWVSQYWLSCRALLALTISLGLQAIVVLMLGIGPLATLPHDPATLTNAGRFFLAAEYDALAYTLGCVSTITLACAGIWVWNLFLYRIGGKRANRMVLRSARALFAVALASIVAFAISLSWLGPGLAENREVAGLDLLRLSLPGLLAVPAAVFALVYELRRSTDLAE